MIHIGLMKQIFLKVDQIVTYAVQGAEFVQFYFFCCTEQVFVSQKDPFLHFFVVLILKI